MTARTDQVDYRMLNASRVGPEAFPAVSPVTLLYRYWQSVAPAPDSLPGRQHIDPLDIGPTVMPWIFLLDVVRGDALDYTFRLVGTGNVSLVGRDATGQLASDVFGRVGAPFVLGTFDRTVADAAPTFWIATVPHDRFGEVTIHRGLFPLARDGHTVDMLLRVAAPWPPARPPPAARAGRPLDMAARLVICAPVGHGRRGGAGGSGGGSRLRDPGPA